MKEGLFLGFVVVAVVWALIFGAVRCNEQSIGAYKACLEATKEPLACQRSSATSRAGGF